jgi:hypothetical protein
VSAETPAAAQALAQGRSELHQSLSSLGVSLLRLDINSQPQTGARDERFDGGGEGSTSGAASSQEDADSPETAGEAVAAGAPAIAGGALVDVLA